MGNDIKVIINKTTNEDRGRRHRRNQEDEDNDIKKTSGNDPRRKDQRV